MFSILFRKSSIRQFVKFLMIQVIFRLQLGKFAINLYSIFLQLSNFSHLNSLSFARTFTVIFFDIYTFIFINFAIFQKFNIHFHHWWQTLITNSYTQCFHRFALWIVVLSHLSSRGYYPITLSRNRV